MARGVHWKYPPRGLLSFLYLPYAPAELNDLDDVTQSTSSTQSNVAAADIDKISEQLNSLHAAESSPIEDDFIEVESTTPEDIYSDDDDDDFSLTDFKDI